MSHLRVASMLEHSLSRRTLVRQATIAGVGAGVALAGGSQFAFAHQGDAGEGEYPEVVVVATEMAFDVAESFEGGFVKLTLDNQGSMDHHVMMLRVNDDATADDVVTALQEPSFGAVFGLATSLGGPAAGPGLSASVIVNLPAGSYVLICAIPGPDGMPHYQMGMQAVVEVVEPTTSLEAPVAASTVELMEMMFHGMGEGYAAGPTTWEVVNAGAAVHELLVMQLAEGFTGDMFISMVMAPPAEATPAEEAAAPDGPPPFAMIGGVAPMSPGDTNYLPLDLVAGEYVAICFVPDPETGAPHAALGMVMPFVVE